MKYQKLTRFTMLFCLTLGLAFVPSSVNSSSPGRSGAAPAKSVSAVAASPAAQKALRELRRAGQAPIMTQVSRQTGSFNFVRISGGDVLAVADRSATPQARALAFLAEHGDLVGMNDLERAADCRWRSVSTRQRSANGQKRH